MITTAAHQILNNAIDPRASVPEEYWELLEQYRAELINQAMAILGNREDAEDVVQKTFCEAFSDPKRIPQASSVGQWLRMINRRNALDRARERHRSNRDLRREGADQAFTTGGFSMLEIRDAVRKAVQTLPAELRPIVEMRYFQHQSSKQISEALKIPLNTIKRRLFQANVLLHATLKKQFKTAANQPITDDTRGENAADETDSKA